MTPDARSALVELLELVEMDLYTYGRVLNARTVQPTLEVLRRAQVIALKGAL